MAPSTATLEPAIRTGAASDDFDDLDVSVVEVLDPAHLVSMTDDNCGSTCEKSTCISAV
ncbi:FxLD family lanthipeptide [Streptacidiphilus albus]|uniref:FxLD family lanthipeptide n=1 Tax=Streptacidiphilus albus TaxID=105425 RepID=UPI0009DD2E8A|nr:FxLD family lanthipeptide [Streptacidiphilus albus]